MHTVSMEVKGRADQRLVQGEETRSALLAAARQLFGERGYGATTLDDIAALAGLTKGAVYHHFGGKRELFQAVFEQIEREVSDRVVTVFLEPDHWWGLTEGCQLMIDAQLDPAVQRIALTTPATFDAALDRMPEGADRMMYAATRTTLSPNIAHSGVKVNVIPDSAEIDIDIRTLPGDDGEGVRTMLRDAAGDLWKDVEVIHEGSNPATASPLGTPLWDALTKVTQRLIPGSTTMPFLIVGATDARYFRRKGVVSYGYGLMSDKIPFGEFSKLFHGNNERIDQGSLELMTPLWDGLVREMLG